MASRIRLDHLLVQRDLFASRTHARAMIMAGHVLVDRQPISKAGTLVSAEADIVIRDMPPYVSRGGLKLEKALQVFEIDCSGLRCMDVGASTGGFTDCLLQHGAARVYAVDVGYGQLAWKLRQDSRVMVLEKTNIRHLDPARIPDPLDLITIDTAFISLKLVVPAVLPLLGAGGCIVALIKPQFEVGKGRVGKQGVVRDAAEHTRVIQTLTVFFSGLGLQCSEAAASPILGPRGNREFLIHLRLNSR